jgi:phage shock protein A
MKGRAVTSSSPPPPEPIDAEIVSPATPQAPDYDERGVPSLDYVRDKIESRYATALGSTDLTEGTPVAQSLQEQQAQREKAAAARLDEIRRTLKPNSASPADES